MDRLLEVSAELRQLLLDAPDRFTKALVHRRAGPLRGLARVPLDAAPAPLAALFRLRETQWGGPVWSAAEAENVLRETGFVDVRALPTPPGAVVTWVVGRRKP